MTFFNWLRGGDDYHNGYDAADEFLDIVDHDLSDEECHAQWDAVESGHSDDYVQGFVDCIEDTARPWWKLW